MILEMNEAFGTSRDAEAAMRVQAATHGARMAHLAVVERSLGNDFPYMFTYITNFKR